MRLAIMYLVFYAYRTPSNVIVSRKMFTESCIGLKVFSGISSPAMANQSSTEIEKIV